MDTDINSEEDIWARYRPPAESSKTLFYRYENEGVVVYDSSARFHDEQSISYGKVERNSFNLKRKVEIINVEEYGIV